jgi:uncharacterized protein (TIGR00255 family)
MIHSMTGYACVARTLSDFQLSVELKSVNSRYLDLAFRLPEELRPLESQLREQIGAKVARGKLECRVALTHTAANREALEIDRALVERIGAAARQVQQTVPEVLALQVGEILRWPGVIGERALPSDELAAACRDLVAQALDEFNAARAREGAKLAQALLERAARMQELVQRIAPKVPQLVKAYEEKLRARIAEAKVAADEDRMRQEIVLFASRVDVDEELSRLGAHLKELEHVLGRGGAVGRRLDFLMQEFNREANTLGSKSADLESTQVAVELKVLIEQMREQVQNIE